MAIPKLVYAMSVLAKPKTDMLERLEGMFRKFIWGTGKPRISLRDLEKDIPERGLKLTNIASLNNALKLSWIKRVMNKPRAWQSNFENVIGIDRNKVWELDILSLKHLSGTLNNQFWEEVLLCWCSYKSCFVNTIDVRTFPIWNTFFTVSENLILLRPKLQNKGVYYINDLLDQSGNLMGYSSFKKNFEMNLNFVDFYSLTHAIPRSWKTNLIQTKIKLDANMVYQKVLSDILSMDKVCKRTYGTFVNTYKSKRKNIEKWILGLNQNIEVNSFKMFHTIPFISTIDD